MDLDFLRKNDGVDEDNNREAKGMQFRHELGMKELDALSRGYGGIR